MSDYISKDILVLIFKYLPVKSLLQFRCVCKEWKQLIYSPALVLSHLSVQKPTFIVQNGLKPKFLSVDPLHRPRRSVKRLKDPIPCQFISLFGTHHGVVCLFDYYKFLLWNPSIRKISCIHRPEGLDMYLFLEDDKLRVTNGFWISPSTKEFKIISLQRSTAVKCFLYSSVRGNWGVIPTPTKVENWKICTDDPPVMIGDVAHWGGCLDEAVEMYHWDHDHQNKVILSFDFVQEHFEIIELPKNGPEMPLGYTGTSPFRWKDALSFVCWSLEFPGSCKMFLRRDDSWIRMFDLQLCSKFQHVFWVIEDLEEPNERGKSKIEIEASDCGFLGAQDNFRVLATIASPRNMHRDALIFEGTRSGCKSVGKGLQHHSNVFVAYNFVESLLFP